MIPSIQFLISNFNKTLYYGQYWAMTCEVGNHTTCSMNVLKAKIKK